MKAIRTLGAAGALALSAMLPAATNYPLHVHVPFTFILAGQQFAAGEYAVQENENGIVVVQGKGEGAAVLSVPAESAKPGTTAALVFRTLGTKEYLIGVRTDDEVSRSIPLHLFQERRITFSH